MTIGLLAVMMAAAAPGDAVVVPSLIEQAIAASAGGAVPDAARVKQALERVKDLPPAPDVEADGMIGLATVTRDAVTALAAIDRALSAGPTPREAAFLSAVRAGLIERTGTPDEAVAAWRALTVAAGADAGLRRTAWYALARLALGTAGETARDAARQGLALAMDTGGRWEGHLLEARADALAGRASEADARRVTAWAAAPYPDDAGRALARTAGDLGLRLHAQGLIAQGDALLKTAGTLPKAGRIATYLPPCGSAFATTDAVTLDLAHQAYAGLRFTPVAASTPAAVAPARAALAAFLQSDHGLAPDQTATVRIRCRLGTYEGYHPAPRPNAMRLWMVARGYRPIAVDEAQPAAAITLLHERIADVTARHGPNDPRLIWPHWQLASIYGRQSFTVGSQYQPLALEARAAAERLLTANGAPADVVADTMDWLLTVPSSTMTGFREGIARTIREAAVRKDRQRLTALGQALGLTDELADAVPSELAVLAAAYTSAGIAPDSPAAQSLALTRIGAARRAGPAASIRQLVHQSGIPKDQCNAADTEPKGLETIITTDDYPAEAIRAAVEGHITVQFDVARDGRVQSPRILVSSPAGIFDAVVLKAMAAATLTPVQRDGRAAACTGATASFTFRLPDPANGIGPDSQTARETGEPGT